MSEFAKDSLSLEETNKLRISLGLKPLAADSDDEGGAAEDKAEDKEEIAERNYAKYKEDLDRKREEEKIRERIQKAQNKRELAKKLRGPTLGEAEPETQAEAGSSKDALKWLKQRQKRAKEHAARRQKEQEELEAQELAQYGEKDVAGLRVAHDVDDFDLDAGGEGRILTLKDAGVLDDAEDELVDTTLGQAEQDRLNAERRKGAKKYTGLDDDEDMDADQIGRKKGVLSKYDADIREDGRGDKEGATGFRLGEAAVSRRQRDEQTREETARQLNKTLLDLDYVKNQEASDYLQEGDVGFKKPKLKKRKKPSRVKVDEDDEGTADVKMEDAADATPISSRPRERTTDNFVDDDELAQSLARARKAKAKRSITKMTPEQIAKNLAAMKDDDEEEREASAGDNGVPTATSEGAEGVLTFDGTSEFVRNIKNRPNSPEISARRAAAAATAREERERRSVSVKREASEPPAVKEEPEEASAALASASSAPRRAHVDDSDEEMEYDMEGATELKEEDDARRSTSAAPPPAEPGLGAPEQLVESGMAAALSILRSQGLLQGVSEEQKERERQQKEYDRWLARRKYEDRQREAERAASKAQGSAKDQATREMENRQREIDDARRAQEKFKDYKPDIDIKYHDEYGRTLNPHEAWKNLSHTFHGKMPGQKKQEIRRKRIEEEFKRQRMAAGDTPTGMAKNFAERAERMGEAGMVIGVGTKNNAPQDMALLGPNTVQRDHKGKGREKASSNGHAATASGSASVMRSNDGLSSTLPPGGLDSMGTTSMVPRSTIRKAAFQPVRASPVPPFSATATNGFSTPAMTTPTTNGNASALPGGGARFKLAFAPPQPVAGVKREASEDSGAERDGKRR